jgi:hypothetical protein
MLMLLRLRGEIYSHDYLLDCEKAEASYRGAMAVASELGMSPIMAQSHLGLGTLYRRTGQRDVASMHLGVALGMFREMDMTWWLEKAEAELAAACDGKRG